MPKVILTAGHAVHNGTGTGAKVKGFDEAIEAVILRNAVAARLIDWGVNVYVDQDDTTNAATWSRIKMIAHDDDILLDIHFNAASPQATGTEVFFSPGRFYNVRKHADELSNSVAQALRLKDRGAKHESQSQHNRLGVLHLNPERSFLLEACFLTNPSDVIQYRYYFSDVVHNVAEFLTHLSRKKS